VGQVAAAFREPVWGSREGREDGVSIIVKWRRANRSEASQACSKPETSSRPTEIHWAKSQTQMRSTERSDVKLKPARKKKNNNGQAEHRCGVQAPVDGKPRCATCEKKTCSRQFLPNTCQLSSSYKPSLSDRKKMGERRYPLCVDKPLLHKSSSGGPFANSG